MFSIKDLKKSLRGTLAIGSATLLLTGVALSPAMADTPGAKAQKEAAQAQNLTMAEPVILDWPEISKNAANTMIQKYGPPAGVTDQMLVWENNGPWKRTIVYRDPVNHDFPMPHQDVLEQFIAYEVPVDKFDELAAYDGSVIAERTKGEISARCDKEAANFLAINLADDIVKNEKTVEEARDAYAQAVQSSMQGDMPETMQGFTFDVNPQYAGDPDTEALTAQLD